jgi:hypothetical protein
MDPLGVCAAFDYMDDVFYDIFDNDYPDWEDDIYYNTLGCGFWGP